MKYHEPKILKNFIWNTPETWPHIKAVDMHTEGEPLRVFLSGLPEIKGDTIIEKMQYFKNNYDHIRTGTMFEPRGHADMYGAIITDPVTPDGDFGVFFLHNEGYSSMCGHAIIALTKLAVETGMVNINAGNPFIQIDAPPGRIVSTAKLIDGVAMDISFVNVPSYVLLHDKIIELEDYGEIRFDVAYGGAYYAFSQMEQFGIEMNKKHYADIINLGKRIKNAVMKKFEITHPYNDDLGFLYGTIFYGKPCNKDNYSRNVCIFAEGELDRSPTGSGVSARAALHHLKGEMEIGKAYTIESILGTTMNVEIIKTTQYASYNAVIPKVSGTAHITGMNEFIFDPGDPLKNGFIFR
jgi:trans-L-3-hydroxyproline dehydratase